MRNRARALLIIVMLLSIMVVAGCGGGDEESAANEVDALAVLGERVAGIERYIAGQVALEEERKSGGGGRGMNGEGPVAEPVYSLARENASENELAIVLWMAECTTDSYLNPELPDQVRGREIENVEASMWEALETGQYVSFEQFIGQAFSFCRAIVVEGE